MAPIAIAFGILPVVLLGFLFGILWIVTLIDVLTRKFINNADKTIWLMVLIFTGFLGSIIYYAAVLKHYKPLKWFWITVMAILIIWIIALMSSIFIGTALWD